MTITAAAYIRVSSKKQDHASQRDAIERSGAVIGTWYAEKASAKTTARAELQRLLSDVRHGLITDVWVFKMDRLTRSGVADTYAVITQLRAAGVTLHCVADSIVILPGKDIVSDVMIFALSLAADLERVAINDRIAAARTRLEAAGQPWGRPLRMTPAEVLTAKRMASEGSTVRAIAKALGAPKSTIARAIKAA